MIQENYELTYIKLYASCLSSVNSYRYWLLTTNQNRLTASDRSQTFNLNSVQVALGLDKTSDGLPAQSRTVVTALAKPVRRGDYTWTIYYEIINEEGQNTNPGERILLSELSAEAVYPTLSVVGMWASYFLCW